MTGDCGGSGAEETFSHDGRERPAVSGLLCGAKPLVLPTAAFHRKPISPRLPQHPTRFLTTSQGLFSRRTNRFFRHTSDMVAMNLVEVTFVQWMTPDG
jgi:hypothetical protein